MNTDTLCTALSRALLARAWQLCTAESCTGGLIAARCTAIPGSSDWFERGFVSYSNASKSELLAVAPDTIEHHGAVSEAVACAMAAGALAQSKAQVSVAVTGIAGPTGGTADKPVGTVWFAWSIAGQISSERFVFEGDRAAVREATVQHALEGILARLPAPGNHRPD